MNANNFKMLFTCNKYSNNPNSCVFLNLGTDLSVSLIFICIIKPEIYSVGYELCYIMVRSISSR